MNISIEQIRRIIDMAHAANAADAGRKHMPLEEQILNPTKEETALIEAIEALPQQEQIELQALMWLGRGDFSDFRKALKHSEEKPHHISTYVTEKTPLPEYLSDGLKKLPENA
jgi:hypothetical protein